MKSFVLAIFVCGFLRQSLQEDHFSTDWATYKLQFNKTYESSEEEEMRKNNFLNNLNEVIAHNTLYEEGRVKYDMGLSSYADLSFDEFVTFRTGLMECEKPSSSESNQLNFPLKEEGSTAPKQFDWRNEGIVTKVRNQGRCGSCWAFAALGNIESQIIKVKVSINNLHLSEQQLLDCTSTKYAAGCDGGSPFGVFHELRKKKAGVAGDNSYSYETEQNMCRRTYKYENFYVSQYGYYYDKQVAKEDDMKQTLLSYGPLVVGFAASINFSRYRSGIFEKDTQCTDKFIVNHAVLLIGYGETEDGTKYWIIKNSWGEKWGEKGYGKISRGTGLCKIGTYYGTAIMKFN